MNIKVIKSDAEYATAMARLSELMSMEPLSDSEEESELELLALVIEDYERQSVPAIAPDPIEAILFRMDQANMGQKDLIPYIGSVSKVSEVLSRKRPLSLSMIRRLHKGLGIPADVLIGDGGSEKSLFEQDPEIDFRKFPLKEMQERGYFGEVQRGIQELKDYAEDLVRGFVQDLLPGRLAPALLRAPLHQSGSREADPNALMAWRICALRKARAAVVTREYIPGSITSDWLRELARLSAFEEGPKLAREYLARHGIALVIEPHFKKTFLDGAAMLDGERPVVALTLRHDRLDNFWFALFHELGHVSKHLDAEHPVFIDDLDREDPDQVETEANQIASEALIPAATWASASVRRSMASRDVLAFADKLGIHPAIVAGRLRRERANFRLFANLIGSGQVRKCFVR